MSGFKSKIVLIDPFLVFPSLRILTFIDITLLIPMLLFFCRSALRGL
uniref:Uncharacterized protein n=1 Tax=Lepeophtheirus salmonis TaxID=72036 RepID=A0A0K2UEU9_LEPSM